MIDYNFYYCIYSGRSIPDGEQFMQPGAQAAAQLARYKRIYTVTAPDENSEAMAICAMADALYYFQCVQNGTGGAVSSASIGSVSVQYAASGTVDLSPRGQAAELYRCARLYLDIYRGCGGC